MTSLYDISPPIGADLKVWPGDTPPTREVLCDMRRGDNITLSTLHSTVHLGAHADAPSHYGADAASIDVVDLANYLGMCQVQRVRVARGQRVVPEMLPRPIEAERLLIATGSYEDPTRFREDFAALDPRLIEQARAMGVRLIGIDTPSVDLFDSKDLPSHRACLAAGIVILEGLVLKDVPEGTYELIALPLRLQGFDASPVRAVLRSIER